MTGEGIAGPRTLRLALGGAAIALFTWWAVHEGGTAPGSWYPGALLFVAALTPVAYALEPRRLSRPAVLALAPLAAFTVWSFLSITWADARGDAWDGANRTLLYLVLFALFAALPWTALEASILLGAFALVTAVAGAWAVGATLGGSDGGSFLDGRLAAPIGYENASAALLLAAFWPAVLIASARSTPASWRGLLLATAGLLLALAVLCQSRGSLIAGPAALAVALLLVRERRRLLLALSAVAATTLVASPLLLKVYAGAPALDAALGRAAIAIALSMALLAAAGHASARLDGRAGGMPRLTRRGLGAAFACALVALAIGAGLAVARSGDVTAPPAVGSRFTGGVESGRYDFWRVAWRQFTRHPLQGAGADNFAHDYARERRGREEPLYPHSIVFRTLGQTGIVGVVLLVTFLGAAFAGVRSTDALRRPVAVAALVAATAWLAHASLDWLWELPAVAAPAMAWLGLVAGLGMAPRVTTRRAWRPGRAFAVAAVAGTAAVSLALPALAARQIERAVPRFADDPAAALHGLERARGLNPLSDRPDVIAGALTTEAGDLAEARRALRRALARDAGDWHTRAQLGMLELEAGRRSAALAELSRAQRLNPLEPTIALAAEAARRGEPLPAEVQERLSDRVVPAPLGRRPLTCRPVLGLCAQRPAA
jgi:tetratricopeptide (TPR) repeat protein